MPEPVEGADAALLSADNLVKRFGGISAVDGMSLQVKRGEIVGLIGPNGAGKTTMFDLIAGAQSADAGSIRLDGAAIETLAADRRVALGLGRTFQIPRPFPTMSVVENVMVGAQAQSGERIWPNWFSMSRVASEERLNHDKALELVDFVGLSHLATEPARVLSGGQRKLLELARALMADPKILLLDEPAAGVNPTLLASIVERILALNARGMTVLVIEHNMDVVARLCRHVTVMASGRLLAEGTPDEVARDPQVAEAYLGGLAA
ncbi:MAG: ABC transporter ATP-binding protein [Ancalomicrobiaceae bacterium]|nr:ABC transporter ATP-binding protein [Ancalomicrobiaceae bacterium]